MNELLQASKLILTEFIKTFLPKSKKLRKTSNNEIGYLSDVLNKVFIQNFNLKSEQVLKVFEALEYGIVAKKGKWDSGVKDPKPSIDGTLARGDGVYKAHHADYIYVAVEPLVVKELMLATFGDLPPSTGLQKLDQHNQMRMRLSSFKQAIL